MLKFTPAEYESFIALHPHQHDFRFCCPKGICKMPGHKEWSDYLCRCACCQRDFEPSLKCQEPELRQWPWAWRWGLETLVRHSPKLPLKTETGSHFKRVGMWGGHHFVWLRSVGEWQVSPSQQEGREWGAGASFAQSGICWINTLCAWKTGDLARASVLDARGFSSFR